MTKSKSSKNYLKNKYKLIWEELANKIHFSISPQIVKNLESNKIVKINPSELSSYDYDIIVSKESILFWKKFDLSHPFSQFSISLPKDIEYGMLQSGEMFFKRKV